jgi:hypothetical protein
MKECPPLGDTLFFVQIAQRKIFVQNDEKIMLDKSIQV